MTEIGPLDPKSDVKPLDIAHLILSIGELREDVRVLGEELDTLRKLFNGPDHIAALGRRVDQVVFALGPLGLDVSNRLTLLEQELRHELRSRK